MHKDSQGYQAKHKKVRTETKALLLQNNSVLQPHRHLAAPQNVCECVRSDISKLLIYIHISTTHLLAYRMCQIGY